MAFPGRTVAANLTTSTSGVAARTTVGTSGTVHHLGHTPVRPGITPFTNLQQGILAMSMAQKASTAAGTVRVSDIKPITQQSGTTVTTRPNPSPGPSPRKKIKIEETTAPNLEIATSRKLIIDERHREMREIKLGYVDHLTECFFLQNGGQMMDYLAWRRRPTQQLAQFLRSGQLDSDDDEDENPLLLLQEKKINEEVKVLTTCGSNVPVGTPVAISMTLPASVAALSHQGTEGRKPGGRHGMVYGHVHHPTSPAATSTGTPTPATSTGTPTPARTASSFCRTVNLATTTVTMATAAPHSSSGHLHRSVSDSRLITLTAQSTKTVMSTTACSLKKSPPASPGRPRKHSTSSFDGIKGITTQEAIVERAKQEAQVMSRVSELRKDGLWSSRRLPKVQEPTRNKAHWDYLLEEMQWLAADFLQERKWKKAAARKVAKMVHKHFQDLESKELKAEKEEGMKLKRVAGQMAKMIKEFWSNIEKVVQYKQNSRLDEKRKKALDLHLNFIVDQTEKYSSWLTEGLAQSSKGSSVGSLGPTPDSSVLGDDEFRPEGSESDDEETIDKDEEGVDESETKDEVAALKKESEVPIEELLDSLPREILEAPANIPSGDEADDSDKDKDDDAEFDAAESDADMEDTIDEQEKHEVRHDVKQELDDLENEGDMTIEDLRAKYAAAYASDYEMSSDSGDGDEDDDDDEEEESTTEYEEDEEEEEDVDVEVDVEGGDNVGLEFLMETSGKDKPEPEPTAETKEKAADPGREFANIAEEALSLQPKGYTLQTTEVKTEVPFLIRHTLREYQHVGLDWLATMYEKRLNGILADEMGLGKTIQTIALLAHLACVKGIWGPHLIVVPTSVMLNWEMEIKKWAPAFKILTYYGTVKERKQKRIGWTKTNAFHICITSYKLVIQDHQSFRRKKWKYFILDEAQNIKNFKSQRWQTLLNFQSLRRLLLTGTPLQNSLMELWSLMHFLMPHVFQSHREFKEWFANPLTGMIEGTNEYNESLVRRLHKVLRPFLLRRLKDDVEKQMPKKYEHVVMCHLSKRQRFLYDEFMAQTKTKETLATGHFMSVINILMQLRKVCNHPSLFEARPVVSPFQMEGIMYHTASLVLKALQSDPLRHIDVTQRYPSLAEMERDLPAFIAHRVRKLQTHRRLIEEIDSQPPSPPAPRPGKLKSGAIRCVSPAITSGRASPLVPSRSVSPAPVKTSVVTSCAQVANREPVRTDMATSAAPPTGTPTPPLQAKVLPQTSQGTPVSGQTPTSQPITVQIQHTNQGTKLVVPSGQLSQLPGFLQIVQTSTGQHVIASSTPSSTAPVLSTTSPMVNGPPVVTMATSDVKTTVSGSVSAVKMSPGVQLMSSAGTAIQLPTSSTVTAGQRPVMRVSPLTESQKRMGTGGQIYTTATSSPLITAASKPRHSVMAARRREEKNKQKKSLFFMESLFDKRQDQRMEKLDFIASTNRRHCDVKPVYGQDLCEAVNIYKDPYSSRSYIRRDKMCWNGPGQIHCYCAKTCENPNHPKHVWNRTTVLSDTLHTPEQYLNELREILDRFVFITPPVQAPLLRMHVSHPPSSYVTEETLREHMIRTQLSPAAVNYHKISTNMTIQVPELRLIQYDCGKLQTMDILLRRLKSGDHRVLIFTQMTRMLDVLEAFLNYHGHRYLRLDGTTKVEQRQLLMDRFNADRRIFCFILSTRSGGIGVNLTGADTVIFYDSDWNPTMDAQAQDRCHRIGQTRDVHIYRLISERTVEENILKKANQKRMLGDMAIEGGNFTTAFFKENTLTELFSEPSGLDSLVKEKEQESKEKALAKATPVPVETKPDKTEVAALTQFEKALAKTEDESDAIATEKVRAEQKAELAEFDENIPWDEREAEQRDESQVEQELALLDKELTPIERYAVTFAEQQLEPVNAEELLIAEEDIASSKENWELNRLKALKEEEERRAEMEDDEMLYTYSRDDAYTQVFLSDVDNEQMPMWSPPTPPHDDNDVYIDQTLFFLYEPTVMPETQLPPVYVRKEKKKIKIESITTRKQKQRKEEQPRVPRSLFDRPTAQLLKLRRDAKIQKLKQGQIKLYRPMPSMPSKPIMESAPDHPEWLIHEDWALLQSVQSLFDVPLNLMIVSPAHTPNWDMVADVVNSISRVYRSPKQCRLRYENVIIPREEGRILYDVNPRKQKKTKGIYKMTKNNRPMKTSQIHSQDSNSGITILYSLRFDSVKSIATKRPPTMRQTLVNPTTKNPKHASVLQENSISYDQPLNPMQVAEIRAQRIQREKKQSQQQAAAQQAQTTDQPAVATTPGVANVVRPVQGTTIIPPQVSAATIVAVTSGVTTQLATIGNIASAATVLTVTGQPLSQTGVRQRAPLTLHETTTGQIPIATSQVRTQLPVGTTTVTTALNAVQLQQRIAAGATTLATTATVQQQLQAAGKTTLTPQHVQLLRTQTLLKQQQQQQAMLQQQQQLRNMQKLTNLPGQLRDQQQLRQLKGPVIQGQKTVIAQQLVTSMAQPVKPGQLKSAPVTVTRPLTQDELTRLKQQQLAQKVGQGGTGSVAQIQHAQTGQLQTVIAQGPVQQVAQSLSGASAGAATLVKTVSAPSGSVTIPVSINVPHKAGVAKVSQISHPQLKQMHLLQQRKPPTIPVQKPGMGPRVATPQMLNAVQIVQQGGAPRGLTVHHLQQLMKGQPHGATIQQIIHTSQPTIIATVTQSQAPQMVTKVIATSGATSHVQSLAGSTSVCGTVTAASSPVVTLSQVPSLTLTSLTPGHSPVTASIVKSVDNVTTVQIQPVSSLTQSKISALPQNVVVQPIQHVTVAPSTQGTIHTGAQSPQLGATIPHPGLHVTVAATPQSRPSQAVPAQHIVQSQQATPTVSTVTVTPTVPAPSPVHTPQPQSTPSHTPVPVAFSSPAQSAPPTTVSTQPVNVSDQMVQQTVAAVLQPPRTVAQSAVHPVAQPPPTPTTTQTVHIQQVTAPPTIVCPAPSPAPTIQTLPPGHQAPPTTTSPQSGAKSAPAPYAMRTRTQSKSQ